MSKSKILVTGANGFIGKNLCVHLGETAAFEVLKFQRDNSDAQLVSLVSQADAIIHLAGENRPKDSALYEVGNVGMAQKLADAIMQSQKKMPVIFTSSAQANRENEYGQSKRKAEAIFNELASKNGNPVAIYRLPNVFGKWARPNYNSAVATFCSNIVNDLPIEIHDANAPVSLVYIDDVISNFLAYIKDAESGLTVREVTPVYQITVGELAQKIECYKQSRLNLRAEAVGAGLDRALYATFMSYYQPAQFSYGFPVYGDERGLFAEVLKTSANGQFSFFTAKPGEVRGGHYHHTKSEKFIVVQGKAKFSFHHLLTNQFYEIEVSGKKPCVVETIPGWAHNIANVGDDELIALLWANEVFDRELPDTYKASM
jgi:UDP-2-acetamido-2,6-beta-L-arabino-hexul-4-ose reductase